MKILIAGDQGQVGHELSRLLKLTDHEVVSYNRASLDVCDYKKIYEVFNLDKPDIVVNASAYTSVDLAEDNVDECYAVNADAPKYIAEACEQIGAMFIHISTDYVFDGLGDIPYSENDRVAPIGVYGKSKLDGENALMSACSRYLILRTSWVFGLHGNNFLKTMLRVAEKSSSISVVSDQFGAPTSSNGIAGTIISIINQIAEGNDRCGIYHYSGYPYTSWYDFAKEIFKEANKQSLLTDPITLNSITSNQYKTTVERPKNSRLNCNKLKSHFKIEPDDWVLQMIEVIDMIKSLK
jgi:dTDP-4-dehydrorhamnose reductase